MIDSANANGTPGAVLTNRDAVSRESGARSTSDGDTSLGGFMDTPEQSPEALAALKERQKGAVRRPCLDCTACCDQFEIKEIEKKAGCACPFAKKGACGIYGDPSRPVACQTYTCLWVMGYGKQKDRPDKSGVIVDFREGLAGLGLYGHLTREPDARSLRTLERFSEETGLDVHLEKK